MKFLLLSFVIFINACASIENKNVATDNHIDPKDYLVGVNEKVDDKHLHEYANIWWQWTRTMSKKDNPVADRTGANCHVNQTGEVWFLAGGYGSTKITRTCEVPAGKHIFFPIINMVYWPRHGAYLSCEKVKADAALNNDKLLSINVHINGKAIPRADRYRLKSEKCFDFLGLIPEDDNSLKVYPTATDGYWLMLKPLPKGFHVLKFSAQYNRPGEIYGELAQDIEYKIEVK